MNRPTYDDQGNPQDVSVERRFVSSVSTRMVESDDLDLELDLESYDSINQRKVKATYSKERRNRVPAESLAKQWGTSLNVAKETVAKTTQRGVCYLQGPLEHRF